MNRFKGLLLCFVLLAGCAGEEVIILPTERFTKVYDSELFDADYIPMDVQQFQEGYIILVGRRQSNADFLGVTLIQTDAEGNFVQVTDLADNYVVPSPDLISTQAGLQFTCMDAASLTIHMVTVDDATGEVGAPVSVGIAGYPLALGRSSDGEVLLLHYSPAQLASVITVLGTDGGVQESRGFTIGAGNDALVTIVNHLTREGSELPFFVGQTPEGTYYFNGLYNYTLSLVFTDLSSGEPLGVVQGQETHSGLLGVFPMGGGQFGLATFNFNERFFQGRVAVDESEISATVDLEGNPIPELDLNANVQAMGLFDQHVIFGADTRDRQIMLYAYSQESGELVGTQYYGFGLPYRFSRMNVTGDGGLIITGSVYVADRFQRVALIRLAEEDVNALTSGAPAAE